MHSLSEINKHELESFKNHLRFLEQLPKGKYLEYLEYNDAIIFSIEEIKCDLEGSRCHRCRVVYPSLHIYGNLIDDDNSVHEYEGQLITYDSFSCKCGTYTEAPTKLYFKLYIDSHNRWKHLCLYYNVTEVMDKRRSDPTKSVIFTKNFPRTRDV